MKFLKKGIRDSEGTYYPVHYRAIGPGARRDGKEGLEIRAKDIILGLPKELCPENNTDTSIDYFEKDRKFLESGSALHQQFYRQIVRLL